MTAMKRLLAVLLLLFWDVRGFVANHSSRTPTFLFEATSKDAEGKTVDPDEIVARRITVKGDVQGGYYRSCVLNEAGRFRRLIGTMTPPDDTDTAEIYVEGKRKMVDGFIRWCQKGSVGLSQVVGVDEVKEEEPTGLYDGFYVKTK